MKKTLKALKAKQAELKSKVEAELKTTGEDLEAVTEQIQDKENQIVKTVESGNAAEYRKLQKENQNLHFTKAFLEAKANRIETEPFYNLSSADFESLAKEAKESTKAAEAELITAVKEHLTEAIRLLNEYVTDGVEADQTLRDIQFNIAKDPAVYYRTADGKPVIENGAQVKKVFDPEFEYLKVDLGYLAERPVLRK